MMTIPVVKHQFTPSIPPLKCPTEVFPRLVPPCPLAAPPELKIAQTTLCFPVSALASAGVAVARWWVAAGDRMEPSLLCPGS